MVTASSLLRGGNQEPHLVGEEIRAVNGAVVPATASAVYLPCNGQQLNPATYPLLATILPAEAFALTAVTMPSSAAWQAPIWFAGAGVWITWVPGTTTYATSPNCLSWTVQTALYVIYGIAANSTIAVMTSLNSSGVSAIYTSTTGTSWAALAQPPLALYTAGDYYYSVWWTGSLFVAFEHSLTGGHTTGYVITSANGTAWSTAGTISTSQDGGDAIATWSEGNFCQIGSTIIGPGGNYNAFLLVSTDGGAAWNFVSFGATVNSVAANATTFVVASSSGIYTSTTGTSWTAAAVVPSAITYVCWNGSAFIGQGADGNIYQSTNGSIWALALTNTVATNGVLRANTATGQVACGQAFGGGAISTIYTLNPSSMIQLPIVSNFAIRVD